MPIAGPNSPSSGANDASIGNTAWVSPGNITTSNDVWATAVLATDTAVSNWLVATNFGFSVPSDAFINGVVVEWEQSSTANHILDYKVQLVKAGVPLGNSLAKAVVWKTTDKYSLYGDGDTLWGLSLTPADVNATNFGAAISATADPAETDTAQVDHCRITIIYSESSPFNPGQTVIGVGC